MTKGRGSKTVDNGPRVAKVFKALLTMDQCCDGQKSKKEIFKGQKQDFQKLGTVTFVHLWCPKILQEMRKS